MGSGYYLSSAIKKHGKDSFKKEIIEYFESRKESLLKERELVNIDYIQSDKVYNLVLGGGSYGKRELTISKYARDENRLNKVDKYIINIPESERLIFYADKDEFIKLIKSLYTGEPEKYFNLRLRIGNIVLNYLDQWADNITKCYNNTNYRTFAEKHIWQLKERGIFGTAIKCKKAA
jgi:hypothetical protein